MKLRSPISSDLSHLTFHFSLLKILFFLFTAPFLLSCAHQVPPTGGPPDTDPPKIIATYPAPFTTHFSEKKIAIKFDEYVDKRSVEESIFISPYIGDLEFDWSGTEVEVTFSETLRKNTTYVVNIGTDVVDIHSAQNRMAQAFTLAFSTGDEIDRGAIKGRVIAAKDDEHIEGVMMFAYLLAHIDPDTLNPQTLKPDYITQTGKGGSFFFQHLAFGPYRVFAVKDEYRNLLYDPEVDAFGVPAGEINLTPQDTLATDVLIQLSREDTTMPRLVKVAARDRNHVTAEYSEDLDTSTVSPQDFFVKDTVAQQAVEVLSSFPAPGRHSVFTLVTRDLDSTRGYRLTVRQVKDLAGNPVNPIANSLGFTASGWVDTLGLRLAFSSVRDSTRGIELKPVITLFFTDAIRDQRLQDLIVLKDSTRRTVPVVISRVNDAAIRITPESPLMSLMGYRLEVKMKAMLDWNGNHSKDSVRYVRFETLDAEMLSGIEGSVVERNTTDTAGTILVKADLVGAKASEEYTATAGQDGSFALSGVREGKYIVSAFRDRNRNGKYDAGRPHPLIRSERFAVYSDTLKVRARWPLEGVRIELR